MQRTQLLKLRVMPNWLKKVLSSWGAVLIPNASSETNHESWDRTDRLTRVLNYKYWYPVIEFFCSISLAFEKNPRGFLITACWFFLHLKFGLRDTRGDSTFWINRVNASPEVSLTSQGFSPNPWVSYSRPLYTISTCDLITPLRRQ